MFGILLGLLMALVLISAFLCCLFKLVEQQLNDEKEKMEKRARLIKELRTKSAEEEYVVDDKLYDNDMFGTDHF